MRDYQPLAIAAENLHVTADTLIDFNRAGWINITIKDGRQFISRQDEYRARFVLHLRRKLAPTNAEIATVLSDEKPPYSLDQVSSILARHAAKQLESEFPARQRLPTPGDSDWDSTIGKSKPISQHKVARHIASSCQGSRQDGKTRVIQIADVRNRRA